MYPLFDSRSRLYKSVQKAVPAGTSLRLRLLLYDTFNKSHVSLHLFSDQTGYDNWIMLKEDEEFDGGRFYSAEFSLDTGVYFYHFGFNENNVYHTVGKGEHSQGVTDTDNPFQLTVYSENYKTPDWLKGGIIYQIFPDRFYCSGKEKANVPADRYMVKNWNSAPAYRQTEEPCRLNNDYFGGDIKGITEKLDYLKSLNVTCIYINPVFEAHSNHRYNTADYMKIDPLLGNEEDLKELCRKAGEKGIAIILDGVFSHTGDDSIYFNKYGRYPDAGAYSSTQSPYYSWYAFNRWPNDYSAWWGVPSLPETKENDPSYCEFICGKDGVLRHWLKAGISGWRLDVADELPDSFIKSIRTAVKTENPDALLLGEVWEDATNKVSYGARRRFLLGDELDTVMNYPFAEGIIKFVTGGNSRPLTDLVMEICENYPPCALNCLMNHIGTHDTARILTLLGAPDALPNSREEQASFTLTPQQLAVGKKRLRLAAALQYTLPGVPSVFYGDEAGVQGGKDPFCRAPFPWDSPDKELTEFYITLGKIRQSHSCFRQGDFIPLPQSDLGHIVFLRKDENEALLICVNRWCDTAVFGIPDGYTSCSVLYGNAVTDGTVTVNGEDIFIGLLN